MKSKTRRKSHHIYAMPWHTIPYRTIHIHAPPNRTTFFFRGVASLLCRSWRRIKLAVTRLYMPVYVLFAGHCSGTDSAVWVVIAARRGERERVAKGVEFGRKIQIVPNSASNDDCLYLGKMGVLVLV